MDRIARIAARFATGLLPLWAAAELVLGIRSLATPPRVGEFEALHNAAVDVYASIASVACTLLLVTAVYVRRRRRAALVTAIVLVALLVPVLAVSDLAEIEFELSPGAPVSLNHELAPALLVLLLVLARKEFASTNSPSRTSLG